MSDFLPSYRDYVEFGPHNGNPGTEEWWNSLNQAQRFQLIGGTLPIHPGDSRYQPFAELTHPRDGGDIFAYGPENNFNTNSPFSDPTRVHRGDGITVSPWDNHTPAAQHIGNGAEMGFLMAALGVLGAGLGAGALGGEGLLGGAGAEAGGEGLGLLSNIPEPAFESMNLSGLESAMNGMGLTAGEGMSGLTGLEQIPEPEFNAMNTGGLDNVMQGLNGVPVTELSTNAGLGDTLNNLGGGLLSGSNLSTLLRGAGLLTSLTGLGGGGGGGGNNNNNTNTNTNNGGGKGGGGQGLNVTRQPYVPNPYTQQQLDNYRFAGR